MNKTIDALKLAEEAANRVIEALEYLKTIGIHPDSLAPAIRAEKKALAAIREALAEQEKQEPVALDEVRRIAAEYAEPNSQVDSGNLYWALCEALKYTAPVDAKAIRSEALEEAAKVCDFENHQLTGMRMDNEAWAAKNCAAAIRAMGGK